MLSEAVCHSSSSKHLRYLLSTRQQHGALGDGAWCLLLEGQAGSVVAAPAAAVSKQRLLRLA